LSFQPVKLENLAKNGSRKRRPAKPRNGKGGYVFNSEAWIIAEFSGGSCETQNSDVFNHFRDDAVHHGYTW
jgi:hypothetical protein